MPYNKANLVYYIGAGASATALPVAKCTPDRMKGLVASLRAGCFELHGREDELDRIYWEMESLADRATPYASIDDLAREYHIQRNTHEVLRLKSALSAFLLAEQARRRPDYRYGDFFRYLVDRDAGTRLAMPTDVRVISWNYDEQFERSFAKFLPERSYEDRRNVDRDLQVVPAVGTERGAERRFYDDIFSIFKLNGSAGVRDGGSVLTVNPSTYVYEERDMAPILRYLIHFYERIFVEDDKPNIHFSWEDNSRRERELKRIERFSPVDTVVVVGYSFPRFNRHLDRRILEVLNPAKVYVQVERDDEETVTERLEGLDINSDAIKVIHDLREFYVPSTYSPRKRLSWLTRHEHEGRRGS